MKHSDVMEAFIMLIAELEGAVKNTRQAAAAAAQEGDYDEAQTLLEEARKIEKFMAEIRRKQREWADLGSRSRGKKGAVGPRLPRGQRTPEEAFRLPILRALVELDGQAPMSEVLDRVFAEMKSQLKPADLRSLPSDAKTPRWRNTAQWARQALVSEGLLRNDTPRGKWAISEKGLKYLAEHSG
ncbi:MAG: winged helix-turn-helix domain-containing protein [Anaerolineales bacterium]|nr:winged helix-turn-helix domain-containing protein [Anaerolineales bacterium]